MEIQLQNLCFTQHQHYPGMWLLNISFHSSGKVFHQMLNLAAGICSHSATKALVRSNTDVKAQ